MLYEQVTIDLDTTDVEVYGRRKRGVAFNHQGQRVGRPHVACWVDTATVLAADLLAGNEDPRRDAPALLNRALAALPAAAPTGQIRLRADAGYFAGQLARAALFADLEFAIGARRIAPLWRLLDGRGGRSSSDRCGRLRFVMHRIPGEHTAQVSLAEDQHSVGDLGADRQDEAFGVTVRAWTPRRGS